jgi:hypothetical protein
VLVAEETSDLEPGDVLRITTNRDGKRMVGPAMGHLSPTPETNPGSNN